MIYKKKEEWSIKPIPRNENERQRLILEGATQIREKTINKRPDSKFMPEGRNCKRQVYEKAAEEVKKYKIRGSYIGLAASYMDDIFLTYHPNIFGEAIVVEKDSVFYEELKDFNKSLNLSLRYRKYKTKFSVEQGNILEILNSDKYKNSSSIIDLDLMCCMRNSVICLAEKIPPTINNAASQRCQLLTWTAVGRGISLEGHKSEVEALYQGLEKYFVIKSHTNDYYCDHYIPMKCERFILHRKAEKCLIQK